MADQKASTPASVPAPASGQSTYGNVAPQNAQNLKPLPLDGKDLEADKDSAYGETLASGSTSLLSSIAKGLIENGRRDRESRDTGINIPSDEKQFDSMEAGHLAYTVVESQQDNPYFRSRLAPNAQHIIDLGTGPGPWSIAVADKFSTSPSTEPTSTHHHSNGTSDHKFDLSHLRAISGTLSTEGYKELCKTIYNNLTPDG